VWGLSGDAAEAPAAKYCLELMERGLIHLEGGALANQEIITVSEDGEKHAQ